MGLTQIVSSFVSIAFLWGFAEATLFFIVPDVFLSFVAARSLRRSIALSAMAALGAVCGGLVMYYWGGGDYQFAIAAVETVPAISASLVSFVQQQIGDLGLLAMLKGSITGVPYKIYAVEFSQSQLHVLSFSIVSFISRFLRFSLVCIVCHSVLLLPFFQRFQRTALAVFWIGFYLVYLSVMPWA